MVQNRRKSIKYSIIFERISNRNVILLAVYVEIRFVYFWDYFRRCRIFKIYDSGRWPILNVMKRSHSSVERKYPIILFQLLYYKNSKFGFMYDYKIGYSFFWTRTKSYFLKMAKWRIVVRVLLQWLGNALNIDHLNLI